MAEQFVWRARYPGKDKQLGRAAFEFIDRENAMGIDMNDPYSRDDFIPIQLHVQKDRPVKLTLRSKDVIHSLYIPFLGTKMDAVPGMTTRTHFTPVTTTKSMREKLNDPDFNYEIACAELCGRMHFAMKLILVVDDAAEFSNWYSKQKSWTSGLQSVQ